MPGDSTGYSPLMVAQTQTVLYRVESFSLVTNTVISASPFDSHVIFAPAFGADDLRANVLTLDYNVWEDLGRPDEITVTVRPGDHLVGTDG